MYVYTYICVRVCVCVYIYIWGISSVKFTVIGFGEDNLYSNCKHSCLHFT